MQAFKQFFDDPVYVALKNYLFNYLNRKRLLRWYTKKYLKTPIVDVGCGISPVSPCPEKTLFIDLEKNALQVLEKKGYKTQQGSVTRLGLEKASVDSLYCSEVLEHVKDDKKALRELSRVLRKGGHVFITVPCWQSYWNVDDSFVGHHRRYDPYALQKELENVGFLVVKRKNIGSWLERVITVFLVKRFKEGGKLKRIFLYPYIVVNYVLSLLITLSTFFTSERKSSIVLFICKKQ